MNNNINIMQQNPGISEDTLSFTYEKVRKAREELAKASAAAMSSPIPENQIVNQGGPITMKKNPIVINPNSLYNASYAEKARNKILRRMSMFDGTGYDLTETNSFDEALQGAALDYSATKTEMMLKDSGLPIKDFWAMVKSDDPEQVLGIVKSQYRPVSNREAFGVAEELVAEGNARYEVGGPALGSKNTIDYSRSFLVLRGDDFNVGDDIFNSFVVLNNSFDGSTGVQYQILCQRLVCLNGMVRFLGGRHNQLKINIQHSKSAHSKIQQAKEILLQRQHEILTIKKEAELFIGEKFTKQQFVSEIIPLVLKEQKLVKDDEERKRGQERVEKMVHQLLQAYEAEDTQNYNNSAYKVILALSDWETHHDPLRDSGNGQIYLNRVAKGMVTTAAVAQYIAKTRGLTLRV